MPAPMPPAGPGDVREGKRPALLVLLAVPTLCVGLLGAMTAISSLTAATMDRDAAIQAAAVAPLPVESLFLTEPLSRLPQDRAKGLLLQLADEHFEHRGVTVPLAVLALIACWLLTSGPIAALRRRSFGVPLWRWGCLVNLPFLALALLVLWVRTREVLITVGPAIADALAAAARVPAPAQLDELWLLGRTYRLGWASAGTLWALWLAGSALYLRRQSALE